MKVIPTWKPEYIKGLFFIIEFSAWATSSAIKELLSHISTDLYILLA